MRIEANWGRSIRTRFLLVLLGGAVLPLALIGGWLVRSSERAGEALLRSQLEESLTVQEDRAASHWRDLNAHLLLLADNDASWRVLLARDDSSTTPLRYLIETFRHVSPEIVWVRYDDAGGTSRIEVDAEVRFPLRAGLNSGASATEDAAAAAGVVENDRQPYDTGAATIEVTLPVHDGEWKIVGTMTAGVRVDALVQPEPLARTAGAVLTVLDRRNEAVLTGAALTPEFHAGRFEVGEEVWIGAVRSIEQPPLELHLAAPLEPVVAPFARTARGGGLALLLVAGLVVLVTTYLTTRMTGPVVAATRAAEAIAAGELDQLVPVTGTDEVGRLSRAFNAMTASLRETLDTLALQRTQAALGEFATSLAHEVRNAHTTIGLDLQRAMTEMDDRPAALALLERSLRRVRGVDRVIDGALRVARSGRVTVEPIDLRDVIEGAVRAAQPWFDEADAILVLRHMPTQSIPVVGDPVALETMFLNLLRNAAQALRAGEHAEIWVTANGAVAEIVVEDEGVGMTPDQLAAAFHPFVTSRPDGTGLGLPIARQIACAHGTDIHISSSPAVGTRCSVTFVMSKSS